MALFEIKQENKNPELERQVQELKEELENKNHIIEIYREFMYKFFNELGIIDIMEDIDNSEYRCNLKKVMRADNKRSAHKGQN